MLYWFLAALLAFLWNPAGAVSNLLFGGGDIKI